MTDFSVTAQDNDALLHWQTASEVDNAGFEVQHGVNVRDWRVEGFVPAQGGLNKPADYSFRVPDLSPGTHFFRLRQMDEDGKHSFSDVKSLIIRGKTFHAAFRPNTVHDAGELYFFTEKPVSVQVEMFNAAGIPVGLNWSFELENETVLPVEMSHLPAGIYFAVIQTETERVVAQLMKH